MIESLKFWRDKVNLNVQLSIDGIKEVQDEYRVLPNGSPTFDIVFKNIPKWKGIFSDRPSSLSVHGCINKKTMKYLYINYKYFRDCLGFNRIWYLPIAEENWDEDDIKEYRKQMGLIYDNIVSIVQNENSLNEVYNYAPLDRCFNLGNRSNKPCGAGTNYITINTLGEVFPCHQFYFNDPDKDTLIGNIYTGLDTSKQKVFLEYTNDWFAGCNKCEHGNCYRCIANNYQHRGSMFSQTQGFYCTLMMIDLFYQTKLRKVLIDMGLINNKTNQNNSNGCDLNCRVHTSSTENGCDVVSGTHNDTTNYNHFKELDRTFIEYVNKDNKTYGKYILSDGSIELLEKVDNKENEVRNNKCSCNKDETDNDLEVIASALHLILDKLDEVLLKLK
jgi:radical SAM protein with 4Fe4S-binding SPASM domain